VLPHIEPANNHGNYFLYLYSNANTMTMLELKNILIRRISEINDVRFLEAIKTILDEKAEDAIQELTKEQKKEIQESQAEIQEGLFLYNNDLDQEIQGWLNAK
jgi:hypothetical protein